MAPHAPAGIRRAGPRCAPLGYAAAHMAAAAAPWIELRAPRGLAATVVPPGSKSLTNRALLYAALARGRSTLHGPLESDDTRVMRAALRALDVPVHAGSPADDRDAVWHVEGRGGLHGGTAEAPIELDVATAGTAARFLTAALAAGQVHAHVDGSPRMRERPMAQLTAALRAWGADVRGDRLPLRVAPIADGLPGAHLQLPRPDSSQFVSALLIAAAAARAPVTIELPDGTPATPYVDMTLAIHRAFGGEAGWTAPGRALKVCPAPLRAATVAIEPDASAATPISPPNPTKPPAPTPSRCRHHERPHPNKTEGFATEAPPRGVARATEPA